MRLYHAEFKTRAYAEKAIGRFITQRFPWKKGYQTITAVVVSECPNLATNGTWNVDVECSNAGDKMERFFDDLVVRKLIDSIRNS